MVIASWRPAGDVLVQQAAVKAAQSWCSASIPHCLVEGPCDCRGTRRAFGKVLAEALARREDAGVPAAAPTTDTGASAASATNTRPLLRMSSSMNPLYRFRCSSDSTLATVAEEGPEAALGASAEA